jgi:heme O synthase-like polyprenyltransferase
MTQLSRSSQPLPLLTPGGRAAACALVVDLIQLGKPRITLMVVITALLGFLMGVPAAQWLPGRPGALTG